MSNSLRCEKPHALKKFYMVRSHLNPLKTIFSCALGRSTLLFFPNKLFLCCEDAKKAPAAAQIMDAHRLQSTAKVCPAVPKQPCLDEALMNLDQAGVRYKQATCRK